MGDYDPLSLKCLRNLPYPVAIDFLDPRVQHIAASSGLTISLSGITQGSFNTAEYTDMLGLFSGDRPIAEGSAILRFPDSTCPNLKTTADVISLLGLSTTSTSLPGVHSLFEVRPSATRHIHHFLAVGEVPSSLRSTAAEKLKWIDLVDLCSPALFLNSSPSENDPSENAAFTRSKDKRGSVVLLATKLIPPFTEILTNYIENENEDLGNNTAAKNHRRRL
jgi:hypothetical protein